MTSVNSGNRFFATLHPLSACVYVAALGLLAVVWTHPLFLTVLLLAVWMLIRQLDGTALWAGYLRFCLPFIVLLILVNPLFAGSGVTVIWSGLALPGLGTYTLSLEGLLFVLTMGLRLLVVLGAFLVFSLAVNPDRLLGLMRRPAPKAVTMLLLTTRLYPALADDYRNIKQALAARGARFGGGNRFGRWKAHLLVLRAVLVSALERALEIAEAMHARHYGLGYRTAYRSEIWRPRDGIVVTAAVLLAVIGLATAALGVAEYAFYPAVGNLYDTRALLGITAVVPSLLVPVVLGGGWRRWDSLQSRI